MKPDERALLVAIARDHAGAYHGPHPTFKHLRDIAAGIGMHPKRAQYLFEKWSRKGIVEYGVSAGTGWLTIDGFAKARAILADTP
jgi:hypothetical protein